MTVVRKFDRRFVGRCDGHGEGVMRWRDVMVMREV